MGSRWEGGVVDYFHGGRLRRWIYFFIVRRSVG